MKIKNVSGGDLTVPWLGHRLVLDEQEVAVPAGSVFAYTQQEQAWAPADAEAQAEHDEGLQACLYVLLVEGRVVEAPEAAPSTSARELIAEVATATREQVASLLNVETRPTVIKAAEQRLAELDADDQGAAGDQGNSNAGDAGNGDEDR